MASRFWAGITNDWSSTANWRATRTGVTGASVPVSTDDAFIYDGTIDITANTTAVAALTITIGGNFSGNIPGLTVNTAGCVVTIENVAFGKNITVGADASVTLAQIHVRSAGSGSVTIASGSSGVITLINAGRTGRMFILGSGVYTTLQNAGMPTSIEYSATAATTTTFETGTHTISRGSTTISVGNSVCNSTDSAAFTTCNLGSLGQLNHDSDGTIGTLVAKPGSVLRPVSTKFTITNCTLYEGCTVPRNSDKITFTNPPNTIGNVA